MYELALLTGITTVDDLGSLGEEFLDDSELLLHALVINQLNGKGTGDDGQCIHLPVLPLGVVIFRGIEFTKVSKSPCDLVAVTFHVSVMARRGS